MTPADYARWLAEQGVHDFAGAAGRGIVPRARLQRLSRAQQHRPRAHARRPLRQHGAPAGRFGAACRRALYPRLHPQSAKLHRRRLPADHAGFFRPDQRGRLDEAGRLYPIARQPPKEPRNERRGAVETPARSRTYLTEENTVALLATDQGPQAHRAVVFRVDHVLLFCWRVRGDVDAAASGDTGRACCSPPMYNRMFTMHGVVMVWFFLIPSIPTTLGNFFIPMMIGARDLAFPRINLASWYVFNLSGLVVLYRADHWRAPTPAGPSTRRCRRLYSNGYVFAAAIAVFINGFSSIMTGLNFVVHDPSPARPGHDMDAAAAVRLGRSTRSASSC